MLHIPQDGESVFEIFVYNKLVRALVKENQSHEIFGDHWADVQIQKLIAKDESNARSMISERFPESDGFVLETLKPTAI